MYGIIHSIQQRFKSNWKYVFVHTFDTPTHTIDARNDDDKGKMSNNTNK